MIISNNQARITICCGKRACTSCSDLVAVSIAFSNQQFIRTTRIRFRLKDEHSNAPRFSVAGLLICSEHLIAIKLRRIQQGQKLLHCPFESLPCDSLSVFHQAVSAATADRRERHGCSADIQALLLGASIRIRQFKNVYRIIPEGTRHSIISEDTPLDGLPCGLILRQIGLLLDPIHHTDKRLFIALPELIFIPLIPIMPTDGTRSIRVKTIKMGMRTPLNTEPLCARKPFHHRFRLHDRLRRRKEKKNHQACACPFLHRLIPSYFEKSNVSVPSNRLNINSLLGLLSSVFMLRAY